ncbi:hypothetical protein M104_1486 [Bacteroides fragilis str. 1007-1-F |uniref:Uncharacterized protein n=1 Tax=Bacteroides fragilis str. 1007-1-F \|nr:hypothetical protein M108_1277 [Bacteroides fragilis str. 3397 T14]EXZ90150.1 hypothetical protein M068_1252 [Bacteroides fragilis str. J38-1]EYA07701.1 hypothetical protein M130_3837 [Bacteroides fragilis str. S6R6]EYA15262.1 hypothetical protein M104_1486 [Bacteroides fragilis str. 1007-1-F \
MLYHKLFSLGIVSECSKLFKNIPIWKRKKKPVKNGTGKN